MLQVLLWLGILYVSLGLLIFIAAKKTRIPDKEEKTGAAHLWQQMKNIGHNVNVFGNVVFLWGFLMRPLRDDDGRIVGFSMRTGNEEKFQDP